MRLYKITRAVPRYPVVELTFDDGFSAGVDFSETIAEGGIFASLDDPTVFNRATIGESGRSLCWTDNGGEEVDFCADALRIQAEEQVVRERAARYAASKPAAAE